MFDITFVLDSHEFGYGKGQELEIFCATYVHEFKKFVCGLRYV